MKTYLWSIRWSTAKGWHWKLERQCINTGNEWLAMFKRDEPQVYFILSDKMPSGSSLAKAVKTL